MSYEIVIVRCESITTLSSMAITAPARALVAPAKLVIAVDDNLQTAVLKNALGTEPSVGVVAA